MTYTELIYLADSKYQSLIDAHLWVHQPSNEDSIIAGLIAKVDALSLSANVGLKPKKGDLQDIMCFKCGEKGHYAMNCPKATMNWKQISPQAGESEEKCIGQVSFKWCAHCGLWNKTHIMIEDVVG